MRYDSTILRPTTEDLTGKPFERLTVLRFAGYRTSNAYWTCQCICGTIKDIGASGLRNGTTRSCGCLRRETTRKNKTIHGKRHTPEYRIWHHMLDRCEKLSDAAYSRYGGRGITVSEPWHDFATFLQDMGAKPEKGYTLERVDNNGPYSKDNCIWATYTEQGRNKRNNVILTYNGVSQCISAWAEMLHIPSGLIQRRIQTGWSVERTLITPAIDNARMLTHDGLTMSARAWARTIGMKPSALCNRLDLGWSVHDAITTPCGPRRRAS
jgi:hypothetical protein